MTVDQQARVLRAMRAYLALERRAAAAGADVLESVLLAAEEGSACSVKTWAAMLAFYAQHGLIWRGGERGPGVMLFLED